MSLFPDLHHGGVHPHEREPQVRFVESKSATAVLPGEPSDVKDTVTSATAAMATALESTGYGAQGKRQTAGQEMNRGRSADTLLERCRELLWSIHFPQAGVYLASLTYKKKKSIDHFRSACLQEDLPLAWGHLQIQAFLRYVDERFYTAKTLRSHWKFVKDTSAVLKFHLNEDDILLYDLCPASCKPIKDNKFPVNRALLQELYEVAPKLLQSYDALLVRAILLCAWGGFLRCCEYTEVRQSRKNHNMRSTAVNIMPDGVGLTFYTDKISLVNEQPKYRMISWSFLPAGA